MVERTGEAKADLAETRTYDGGSSKPDKTATFGSSSSRRSPSFGHINRYELTSILGEGSFGTVYIAHDETLQRDVAIKIPRKERFQSGTEVDEFVAEARTAARLRHPGIVTIYDLGVDPDGTVFVIQELVRSGRTLRQVIDEQPLDLERAVRLVAELADAIHHAHKNGVVHRDLKPANVLMDESGRAMISDFGLAVDERTQRSRAGEVSGSPAYMAPEQVRGETHRQDGRADVWSLGVILYELLAGRRPFGGDSVEELFDEILHRDPKPLRQLEETIPVELERICRRCLAKSVLDRYSNASDLQSDLLHWLDTRDVADTHRQPPRQGGTASAGVSRPASHVARSRRYIRAAVFTAIAIVGLVGAVWGLAPQFDRGAAPGTVGSNGSGSSSDASGEMPPLDAGSPRNFVANHWNDLLETKPTFLLWPRNQQTSTLEYHPDSRQLSCKCAEMGLLRLGETSAASFKLQIEVHQSPWVGGIGLFFGYSNRDPEDPAKYRCQVIAIRPYFEADDRRAFSLSRGAITVDADTETAAERTFNAAPLPRPGFDPEMLELAVNDNEITSIRWAGREFIEQLQPIVPAAAKDLALQGSFGILCVQSSTLVAKARFFYTAEATGTKQQ